MRILIIDQCSAAKEVPEWFDPLNEETIDSSSLQKLRAKERTPLLPARNLYRGRQQTYISEATDQLRSAGDTVDRLFISAGFGLIDEDTSLPPYDLTFKDFSNDEIDERATKLEIEERLVNHIKTESPYDIVFLALGSDYYRSIYLEEFIDNLAEQTICVLFNLEAVAEGRENVVSISARNGDSKEHGEIVVALKGKYLKNFAEHREHGHLVEKPEDVVKLCTTEYTTQTEFERFDD